MQSKSAAWRGTTNTDGKTIGVSFDTADGSIVRLSLDIRSARLLFESMAEYLTPAPALHPRDLPAAAYRACKAVEREAPEYYLAFSKFLVTDVCGQEWQEPDMSRDLPQPTGASEEPRNEPSNPAFQLDSSCAPR